MSQMVTGEVDVFTGVEYVDGGRVAKHVNVAEGTGEVSLGSVEAEEILNPPFFQSSLKAGEERLPLVGASFEILA